MKKGSVEFLPSIEKQFWDDLIEKYLYPIDEDPKVSVVTSISATHFPTLNIPIF